MAKISIALGEVKEAICGAISSIVDPNAMKTESGGELPKSQHGVDVQHSAARPWIMRFAFVSRDGFAVSMIVNAKELSRQYLENMMHDLKDNLTKASMTRQDDERMEIRMKVGG
ncbi:MAG: hypothetical protein KAS93_07955 [Gammaproteobacteria bacterium]|nr:hypothetical protein [Gammaproteobacteria bacterium]